MDNVDLPLRRPAVTKTSKWQRVDEEVGIDGNVGTVTERFPVPGGWLYRSRTDTWALVNGIKVPTGAITVSHGFVPGLAVDDSGGAP